MAAIHDQPLNIFVKKQKQIKMPNLCFYAPRKKETNAKIERTTNAKIERKSEKHRQTRTATFFVVLFALLFCFFCFLCFVKLFWFLVSMAGAPDITLEETKAREEQKERVEELCAVKWALLCNLKGL